MAGFAIRPAPYRAQFRNLEIPFSDSKITILFRIITSMQLLFLSYVGDYSCIIQGSFEIFSLYLQFPILLTCVQLQEIIPSMMCKEFPRITVT